MNETRFSVRVPDWLAEAAKAKAENDATDLSRVIRRLVWAWLNGDLNPYRLPDPPTDRPG